MERQIRLLWAEILELDRSRSITSDDDFFRLGGNPATAAKLSAACQAQNISLSIADICQYPCLRDMAIAASQAVICKNQTGLLDPLVPLELLPVGTCASPQSPDRGGTEATRLHEGEEKLHAVVSMHIEPIHGVMLATVICAAWTLLVRRYTGSDDIKLVGHNAFWEREGSLLQLPEQPLSVHVEPQLPVGEFLAQLAEQMAAWRVRQNGLWRSLQVSGAGESEGEDAWLLPIHCRFMPATGTLDVSGRWSSASTLSRAQIRRFVHQLAATIQALARSTGDAQVAALNMSSPCDQEQLAQWNAATPSPCHSSLPELVAKSVARQAHAPALESWDGMYTYQQLDDLSAHVCRYLIATLGLAPQARVVLCLEKSNWSIVTMLAVLKAGATCVPVDARTPASRIRDIVEDVESPVALVSPAYVGLLERLIPRVCVVPGSESTCWIQNPGSAGHALYVPVQPTDVAFIMYTSGSTGKPKGVMQEHAAVCASVRGLGKALGYCPESRVLQFAAYTFDVSVGDIFAALLYGACVCTPSETDRLTNLGGFIQASQINHACLTPTVGRTLSPIEVPSLQTLALGGEPLTQRDIDTWAAHVALINIYGVTETTIWCATQTFTTPLTHAPRLPLLHPANIGYGFGVLFWVVEPEDVHRLAPIGAVGELLIEGPVLARSYLNDDAKSKAVFVVDPAWSRHASRRLYRTGDLVRYEDDGSLIFVGRKDNQVKLRGQRIELGEIESVIKRCLKSDAQVAVELVAQQRAGTTTRASLMAFIAQDDGLSAATNDHDHPWDLEVLAQQLADLLPPHMIPQAFIPLQQMPLTISGKLDRVRLRNDALKLSPQAIGQYTPKTPEVLRNEKSEAESPRYEAILRTAWAHILNLSASELEPRGNFFHLGGDSVAAMELVTYMRREGLSLTVADIFKRPTLSELADTVQETTTSSSMLAPAPFSLLSSGTSAPKALSHEEMRRLVSEEAGRYSLNPTLIQDAYPCTALQEGLMTLSLARKGMYITQHAYELAKDVDIARFQAAWNFVVKDQAIWRTRIIQTERFGLIQIVLNEQNKWDETSHLESLESGHIKKMGLGDPLAHFTIVNESAERRLFVLTAHHVLFDGWSLQLALKQAAHFYAGVSRVHSSIPFSHFIANSISLEGKNPRSFWESYLADSEIRPFPSTEGQQVNANKLMSYHIEWTKPKSNITASIYLRAAWALTMGAYNASQDVIFGVTLTGRNAPIQGIGSIAGPTLATVPLRVRWSGNETLGNFLQDLQNDATKMMEFEQTGLQNIGSINAGTRTACQLSNLLLVQPDESADPITDQLFGRALTPTLPSYNPYGLMLECVLSKDAVSVSASYDEHLISQSYLDRVLQRFEYTLQQLSTMDTNDSVKSILHLSPSDQTLINTWNSDAPIAIQTCVHDLVAERVKQQPDSLAISAWDGAVSYRELDLLSSNIAVYLKNAGASPETVIPLCFNKSKWAVVAMLGVLRAGAAYVSLDPTYPCERLEGILSSIHATIVITSRIHSKLFRDSLSVIVLDETLAEHLPSPPITLPCISPDNAAIAVFTSGSTGTPKGIILSHSAISTSLVSHGNFMGFSPTSRVLQFAAYTFDNSNSDIFATLIYGGCICIPSEFDRMNNLENFINEFGVNQACITPSVAALLHPLRVPSLKTLGLGGEVVSSSLLRCWQPHVKLMNVYGPAECAITSFCHAYISPNDEATRIGYGLGCRGWIVETDDHNRLAPVGAEGELLIEGPVLARGYIGNENLTKSAFLEKVAWANLFSSQQGQQQIGRFYKTGDLVRYGDDGSLIYVGRKDTQVKLRGQRLELHEVEYHLKQALPNYEVVAEVVNLNEYSQALTAFLCLYPDEGLPLQGPASSSNENELVCPISDSLQLEITKAQTQLSKSLATAMIPSRFVLLKDLPRTTSGKTDRRTLRAIAQSLPPEFGNPDSDDDIQSVSTDRAIRALGHLWTEVLQLKGMNVGHRENFFALGGDSIAAMSLVMKARRDGWLITVADIFSHPILSDMSTTLRPEEADHQPSIAVAPFQLLPPATKVDELCCEIAAQCRVAPEAISDIYPCTALQEGLLTLSLQKPHLYIAREVYELPSDLDVDRFKAAWAEVVRTHPIWRTRIVQHEVHNTLQVVLTEKCGISWFQDSTNLSDYLVQDRVSPIELGQPLARFALLEGQHNDRKHFVLTAHHALYDGQSLPATLKLVDTAYRGLELPRSPSMNQFISWIKECNTNDVHDYWTGYLNDVESVVFPRPHGRSNENVATHSLTTHWVPWIRNSSNLTLSTILRAAWGWTLGQYTGTRDAVFGMTLSGRNAPVHGIEAMIAPTITTVPIRLKWELNEEISSFLLRVQEEATGMISFEQTGLQTIGGFNQTTHVACQFNNLLLIQPMIDDSLPAIFGHHELGEQASDFNSYGLMIECQVKTNGFLIKASYDETLIDKKHMQRILKLFEHGVLELSQPQHDRTIQQIPSLSQADRIEISNWTSEQPRVIDACIHELISAQGLSLAPAVSSWDGELTYDQLDNLSSQLASQLILLGVKAEAMVPICLDKSKYVVIAMLATLKAGGAFVPIDPTTPVTRIAHICGQIKPNVVLTSEVHAGLFADLVERNVQLSEKHFAELSLSDSTISDHKFVRNRPDNAAYVIFTSGSTGLPKGCVISHSSYISSALAVAPSLQLSCESRSLQFASPAFDVSIEEIFTTLLVGGCVCIPSTYERFNDLSGAIRRMNVNWAEITPSVASTLAPADVPSLQTLVLSGESMTPSLVSQWASSHVQLVNSYGPTECSITCTAHGPVRDPASSNRIGRALGCRFWVVDPQDADLLVPIGAIGELLVEGPGLARGYLHDIDKTNSSFVEDLSWAPLQAGVRRFYKTGDLVHYNSDGTLTFIGRRDTQVKIRGQRVELGEIEHHLRQALSGYEVVVEPVPRLNGTILVAFAVTKDDRLAPTPNTHMISNTSRLADLIPGILKRLNTVLPPYMVPAIYLPLNYLPLALAGKTDRRKLREAVGQLSATQLALFQPHKGIKEMPTHESGLRMQNWWSRVLQLPLEEIGIYDSFFSLGGESIAAMRLVTVARSSQWHLTVADVFEHPVLMDMAQVARGCEDDAFCTSLSPFSLIGSSADIDLVRQELVSQYGFADPDLEDMYPCTPLQEGLMTLSLKQSGSYIAREVYDLLPTVQLSRFKTAWNKMARSQPIWRTRIVQSERHGTLQVILRQLPNWEESMSSLDTYLTEDRARSMGFGEPLVRLALVRQRYLVLTVHHALYDGWSLPLTWSLIHQAYKGNQLHTTNGFNNFIAWSMKSIKSTAARDFWVSYLAASSCIPFPPVNTNAQKPAKCVTTRKIIWKHDSTHFTPSTFIRAAWALTIGCYTSTKDVVFGATLAGRSAPVPNLENIVGPTITTVPIRVTWTSEEKLDSFLKRLQAESTAMISFEQTGLQNIRTFSEDSHAACQFTSLLLIQPAASADWGSDHFFGHCEPVEDTSAFSSYSLTLECHLTEDGMTVEATHDEFFESQIQRTLNLFQHVLGEISTNDLEIKTGSLNLLSESDLREIHTWNLTVPGPCDLCIHDLFNKTVQERPHAVAIEAWDGVFSYKDLHLLASQLAVHLQALGVRQDEIIPLCFEKSKWAVVAMIAVLMAGGAYASLDPTYPSSRVMTILQSTKARIVLTSNTYRHMFDLGDIKVLPIDESFVQQIGTSKNLQFNANPGDPAIVVFTSGSTGIPKGIILDHRAISTSIVSHGPVMGFSSKSRVLQFANFTFDNSNADIFTTLAFGGCICIPSEDDRMNNLEQFIQSTKVNQACLTPTVASLLTPGSIPTLTTLSLGGEALTKHNLDVWAKNVNLINVYGPAECAIWCVHQPGLKPESQPANIGRPMGCVCWVVDQNDHNVLVPIGAEGELLIEGPIMAKGYLNDPEKTSAAFIESTSWLPTSRKEGARLYKTGDLVRYEADGTLFFLGRKDMQVKLHGQRLELGEVEHHLRQELPKCELAVELVPLATGVTLVAFICFDEELVGTTDDPLEIVCPMSSFQEDFLASIKRSLIRNLPAYMVPSVFLKVRRLPVTTSGKTNRKTLQEIAKTLPLDKLILSQGSKVDKVVPKGPEARLLRKIWAEVLQKDAEDIGAHDNFFLLGGDSIASIRLVRAARQVGKKLTVADIFQHPILEEMALIMVDEDKVSNQDFIQPFGLIEDNYISMLVAQAASLCCVEADQIQDIYPATPLQEGLITISAKVRGTYIMRDIFQLPADLDIPRFQQAWSAVTQSQAIWRTRLMLTATHGTMQVVLAEGPTWSTSHSLESFLLQDRMIDLELGTPLARFGIIYDSSSGSENRYFVLTAHHALYDGWSLPLTYELVAAAYDDTYSSHQTVPFNVFISRINVDTERSKEFWRNHLAGSNTEAFPTLNFPLSEGAKGVVRRRISWTYSASDVTRSTIVKAAWGLTVGAYTGSQDVVFGITLSGRNIPLSGVETIIGPTIATVPLRIRWALQETVDSFLKRIQDESIDMIPFEQTGMQNIRRYDNDTRAACQFSNRLVVHGASDPLPGIERVFGKAELSDDTLEFDSYALRHDCSLEDGAVFMETTYDRGYIDNASVDRILRQFDHLLHLLSSMGESLLGELDIIPKDDKLEVESWNNAAPPIEVRDCAHTIIGRQARQRPIVPAISAWNGQLSYGELDVYSSLLASYLVSRGVGSESLVPFCLDKSKWAPVIMIGILKAGGAFVPLDPSNPSARLRVIFDEIGGSFLIASERTRVKAVAVSPEVVIVNDEFFQHCPFNVSHLPTTGPENIAYIIYTSGSTGKPKGVMIEHIALCSSAMRYGPCFRIDGASRVLQFASYGFDLCIIEILATLMLGGCVCIPSEHDRLENLEQVINDFDVNLAVLTPSVSRLLRPSQVPTLKTLVLGGEGTSQNDLDRWHQNLHLIVAYGPTETSVFCTGYHYTGQNHSHKSIGTLVGCTSWVVEVNDHNKLVPVGASGELVIEGPGLARGYFHDEQKTTASFITNPAWAKVTNGVPRRFYKSGDIVHWASNGSLVFVARKDKQIKLRGQRIELSEIEHHLQQSFPNRKVAAEVVALGNSSVLMAFVCVSDHSLPITTDNSAGEQYLAQITTSFKSLVSNLQDSLSEQLPRYMIPTVFVPLKRMPLTLSGKTDHRLLHEIGAAFAENADADLVDDPEDLNDPSILCMLGVWAEVLKIDKERIRLHSNFFTLGGDSIAAMRLVAACRSEGMILTVPDVFRHPVLRQLSKLEPITPSSAGSEDLLPQKGLSDYRNIDQSFLKAYFDGDDSNIEDVLPATAFQTFFMGFGHLQTRGFTNYFTIQFHGHVNMERIGNACRRVVERHPVLRTVFLAHRCRLLQVTLREIPFRFQEIVCGEDDIDRICQQVCQEDRQELFGMGDIIVRFIFIRGIQSSRLLIRINHAQYDGISMPVLFRDLQAAYSGTQLGDMVPFSEYLRTLWNQPTTNGHQFWRALLQGSSMTNLCTGSRPDLGGRFGHEDHTDHTKCQSDPTWHYFLHGSQDSMGSCSKSIIRTGRCSLWSSGFWPNASSGWR